MFKLSDYFPGSELSDRGQAGYYRWFRLDYGDSVEVWVGQHGEVNVSVELFDELVRGLGYRFEGPAVE